MDASSNVSLDRDGLQVDAFPAGLTVGSTVLVASAGDPSPYAVGLRALSRYGRDDESAVVVTTTESVDRTVDTYERLCPETNRPALGIVDTMSRQQSVSALYDETPVVFTPAPGDLERLVLALSELSDLRPSSAGVRHLVVRSLTPLLDAAPTTRVCRVLDRITGLPSETGLCLLGLDYTAHDEETMAALTRQVDGVLWATRTSSNRLELEYRQASGRYDRFSMGGSD